MTYLEKLRASAQARNSLLCIGLDPDPQRLPASMQGRHNGQLAFNKEIIKATAPYAACYKLNFAFYEANRLAGLTAIIETLRAIPEDIPVIADAKRADIGNTSGLYARAIFETLKFDAITVSPYMGRDSIQPFLDYADKGVYVLCLTSNPGAADFEIPNDLYLKVAAKMQEWNTNDNIGLVVGATHIEQMRKVRAAAPELPFLVPGVGAQGGSAAEVVGASRIGGMPGCVINASRSIIYASTGEDFAQAAAREAEKLRKEIESAGT